MLIKRNNESSNHPNHCKKDVHFALARLICTIVENTEAKMKHLENLKMNLSKFQYSKQLIECGIKKALSVFFYKNYVHLKQYEMIKAYHS